MISNLSNELTTDLAKLLKEEGSFVKELSSVATKAAGFHARLEAIEKALETDPNAYNTKETDELVKKAQAKYSSEIEGKMKEEGEQNMQSF